MSPSWPFGRSDDGPIGGLGAGVAHFAEVRRRRPRQRPATATERRWSPGSASPFASTAAAEGPTPLRGGRPFVSSKIYAVG